jgi:putative ABC transport system ATP-binding protein
MYVISLNGVTKAFGFGDATTLALDDINLHVEEGEFVAIMGPSGSGKSTLLNVIGLLDFPSHGTYQLKNKTVSKMGNFRRSRLRRDHIGYVFQAFNLLPRMTALENVALPLAYKGVRYVKRLNRASEMLDTVGMQQKEYYFPHQLSGGQLQKVAIARALVNGPSIIIADEPTGNLDSASSQHIMELLKDIHGKGSTIIMVTHNPELTAHASRLIYLKDGKIMHDQKLAPGEMINLSNVDAANEHEIELKKHRARKKTAKKKVENKNEAKRKPRKKTTKKTGTKK